MKKTIQDWVHVPGIHCGSVTLRDVMTYYGYNWSEPMCFGIGGGLGFYYTNRDDISPTRMIFVRGPNMETSFFDNLGIPTEWKHADQNVIDIIRACIDRDIPVIIQTDIYYLAYYNSLTHFPGHVVSVWGYDDEKETVLLADTQFAGLKAVDYTSLKSSMASKDPSNPLDNNFIEVKVGTHPIGQLSEIIPQAIRRNARRMIEGAVGKRGESGVRMIKVMSEDITSWIDLPDWKWSARFGYQVIKKRGVGGAGFRWIYRDFLREAENIVPLLKQLRLSEKMDAIGSKWSSLALLLKRISEGDAPDGSLLCKASKDAYELWELESEFYATVIEKV